MSTLATPVIQFQVEQSINAALIFLLVITIMRTLVDFIDVVTRLAESVATGGLILILGFAATAVMVTAVSAVVIQIK